MSLLPRLVLALFAAVIVGGAYMAFDRSRDAEWVVSPAAIAAAKAEGKLGVEDGRGSVTMLPVRSETADVLPVKWAVAGFAAFALVFAVTSRRLPAKPR